MPSAKPGAGPPLTRTQADIANKIMKNNFDFSKGPHQLDRKRKEFLVKCATAVVQLARTAHSPPTDIHRRGRRHINGVFADKRLPRTYTLDKLEMWQGNGLYRWRCKQRGQPPPSWEGKAARKAKKRKKRKGGAQPQGRPTKAQAPLSENGAREPFRAVDPAPQPRPSPEAMKAQPQPARQPPAQAAPPDAKEEQEEAHDGQQEEQEEVVEPPTQDLRWLGEGVEPLPQPQMPATMPMPSRRERATESGCATSPRCETPSSRSTATPPPELRRLASNHDGGDWWLPFRPSGSVASLTPLTAEAGLGESAGGRGTGNRHSVNAMPFPPAVSSRVTRPHPGGASAVARVKGAGGSQPMQRSSSGSRCLR